MRHTLGVLALLGTAMCLTACGQQANPHAVAVVSPVATATQEASSPTTTINSDTSTRVTGTAITIAAAPAMEPSAHTSGEHTVMGCGVPSIHDIGTTFYNDGTSDFTQECADLMRAQAAAGDKAIRCPGTTTFVTDPAACLPPATSASSALDVISNLRLPSFCELFPRDRACA